MNDDDRNSIMRLFVLLRKSRGLSQDEMGNLLGVSGRTVGRWENGTSIPSMVDIMNICREFELSPDELFGGIIDKKSRNDVWKSRNDTNNQISVEETITGKPSDAVFWLFLVHAITITVSFIGTAMSRISPLANCINSFSYTLTVSALLFRNRNDRRFLKTMAVYAVVLGVNLFGNYYYFQLTDPIGLMYNPEIAVINGSIYGFIFLYSSMKTLLFWSLVIYGIWLCCSLYCLLVKKNDSSQEKYRTGSEPRGKQVVSDFKESGKIHIGMLPVSTVLKRVLVVLAVIMCTLVVSPVYRFTYFSENYGTPVFGGWEKYLIILLLCVVIHYGLQPVYGLKKAETVLNSWFTSVIAILFSLEYYREKIADLVRWSAADYGQYYQMLPAANTIPVGYLILLLLVIISAVLERNKN